MMYNQYFISKETPLSLKNIDLIFAVKHNNVQKAIDLLQNISYPSSVQYRKYLSRREVFDLTGNKDGTEATLSYLRSLNVSIVHQSLFGEYITARATIMQWEKILRTEFKIFEALDSTGKSLSFIRSTSCKIPTEIQPHIDTVFNTVQLPPIELLSPFAYTSQISGKGKRAYDNIPANYIDLGDVTTLEKINKRYNIPNNVGSVNSSQSFLSTIGQYFSPEDLKTFQELFGIPVKAIKTVIGSEHVNDDICANYPNKCVESNLDVQYLTSVGQNIPTTFW